ncbi:MAG: YjiG family protein [bacterium]|jgi:spore maturation protein SpmB
MAAENTKKKGNIVDAFVEGARNGFHIGINSIAPNVVFAFALIHVFGITGLLDLIGSVFGPVMMIFGLPGEAVAVLIASWLSMGGGVGVAASLYASGALNQNHVTILIPAIFLMGAQIQYMGRLLGTAEVNTKYYPVLFGICILNALIAMLIMNGLLLFMG